MRRLLLLLSFFATAHTAIASDLLGPAEYLKILTDSKLRYKILSEPSKTPLGQMECERRTELLRVVSKGNEKSLVTWTIKPEAKKLLEEGEVLFQAKKIDEAAAKYKAALDADPEAVSGYFFYGDTLLFGNANDPAAALEQYRKGLALDPTLPSGHFFAATALVHLGRNGEARGEIIKALTYFPGYAAVWKIVDQGRGAEQWKAKPIVRHKFEPPIGYLGVKTKGGVIDVYGGPKFEWIGYATCKAAWANEAQFQKQRATGGGWSLDEERACVLNELMSRYNAAEASLEEQQKKDGVAKSALSEADIIAAMGPLDRHLFEVAQAKLLDGYILFEIIGQHCPLALSISADVSIEQIEAYLRRFVIVAAD
jgi:tetratricopeptide (TPR) repeat protein